MKDKLEKLNKSISYTIFFIFCFTNQLRDDIGVTGFLVKSQKNRNWNAFSNEIDDGESTASAGSFNTTKMFINGNDQQLLTTNNPCLVHYCRKGRECQLNQSTGLAECVCQRFCSHRNRPICGTDGRLYSNHCELHRSACIVQRQITYQRLEICLQGQQSNRTTTHNISRSLNAQHEDGSVLSCASQEYEIMKNNILLYSHTRLTSQDDHSRDFLVSLIFSNYDKNNNGRIEREELEDVSGAEHLQELSSGCNLDDMLHFDDADKNGWLSVTEFYQAFSKLYSVSVVSLDKALETNHVMVRVGDNVEIKCDVTGTPPPPIEWKRNDIDLRQLNSPNIRILNDGSLYLTQIQTIYAGNYTCHAQRNKDVRQTHVLLVYTLPDVRVQPRFQSKRPGEMAEIHCRVSGEPQPTTEWLKNDEPLNLSAVGKYKVLGNGTALQIRNIVFADTGAYLCQATNVGKQVVQQISSLVVQEDPTPTAPTDERKFFVFHGYGIAVYEPSACRLHHQIYGTDMILGSSRKQELVCGPKGFTCSWGRSINVGPHYIYASQPNQARILVISIVQMVVVNVIATEQFPVELFYLENRDEVWSLAWKVSTSAANETLPIAAATDKIVQIIEEASRKRMASNNNQMHNIHHIAIPYMESVDHSSSLFVKNLFMAAGDEHAYLTHNNTPVLYRIELNNLQRKRGRRIDLSEWNCVPDTIAFSKLYGFVIIACHETFTNKPNGQLVIDYLTDAVISSKPNLNGRPMISPDSRHVAVIDQHYRGQRMGGRDAIKTLIVIQKITGDGLEFLFDVKTTLNISDVSFFESVSGGGNYDLFATASNEEAILCLNLQTGKVEMIPGVGRPDFFMAQWNNPVRSILSEGVLGRYLLSPAKNSIFVINGQQRTVNCEILGVLQPNLILWHEKSCYNDAFKTSAWSNSKNLKTAHSSNNKNKIRC